MAETPRLNKYVKDLGYKLRDPVTKENGLADGKLFFLDAKIDYLNRAYASLKRKLGSILLQPEKVFPDYYVMAVKDYGDDTNPDLLSDLELELVDVFAGSEYLFSPIDVYAKLSTTGLVADGVKYQIGWIDPENFFSTKFNANPAYAPNDDNKKYFYTIINGKMVFAAGDTMYVHYLDLFVVNYTKEYSSGGSNDMILPRDYNDLFLTLAAYEAMIDKGDQQAIQKATLYAGYVKGELELIALRERMRRAREDDRANN